MITFRARMYNVTSGEYCDDTPIEYSFAQYYGYTGVEEASSSNLSFADWLLGAYGGWTPALAESGTDVMLGQDGNTLTNIPYTRFSNNRGTNVGTRFEYYAKKYFDANSAWPVLRLLTSDDSDSYYLEWKHSAPNGFFVKSESNFSRWEYVFQWTDALNTQYSDDRKYNLFFSSVFISSSGISELITPGNIKYAGAFRYNDTSGNIDVLVGANVYNVSVTNEDCLKYDAGTYLGKLGSNRYFYKSYNGTTIAMFQISGSGWIGPVTIAPYINNQFPVGWSPYFSNNTRPSWTFSYDGINWAIFSDYHTKGGSYDNPDLPIFSDNIDDSMGQCGIIVGSNAEFLYYYLQGTFTPLEPPSDVDPDNPPEPDAPPTPIDPDNPDPYYDPTSDPDSPDYDPTKDPKSPQYDPTNPSTPHRPPSAEAGGEPPVKPPVDHVTPPPTPPSHALNSRFVTLYTPSLSQLNDLADYLWSPAWSVDGFKKILANPMDCILGLMIFPALAAPVGSKEVHVGNLSTGVTMSYVENQYVELNCGSFEITEYYGSYLDYEPYTKIEIYLPYIGSHTLSADDVMSKTIQLKYMIDLLSGACVAFLVVDGTTLYNFSGSCATSIPVAGNDWSKMLNSILRVAGAAAATIVSGGAAAPAAAGAATSLFVSSHKERIRHGGSVESSAGLMSIQTPYLIITRPRQALPIGQNSFQGYPSFMTESLGSLTGYTEVESCHLEHVPCTAEELEEIERLLKGGVLF